MGIPNSAGPDSGQTTVPDSGTTGTWIDETDILPTLMYLVGLQDDYEHDGRVITEVLNNPDSALSAPGVEKLGACYKQLNSSIGEFGTSTLVISTRGLESQSSGDRTYTLTEGFLSVLDQFRDRLATEIKGSHEQAAFSDTRVPDPSGQTAACQFLVGLAQKAAG